MSTIVNASDSAIVFFFLIGLGLLFRLSYLAVNWFNSKI